MNRKNFVKLAGLGAAIAASGGLAGCASKVLTSSTSATAKAVRAGKAVYVPNGKNRFEKELMIWRIIPLQIKVSGTFQFSFNPKRTWFVILRRWCFHYSAAVWQCP